MSYMQYQPAPSPSSRPNRLATVALVIAIISAALSLIPYLVVITWLPGLVALILGLISGIPRKPNRGRGIAAIIITLLGGVLGIIITGVVASNNKTTPPPTAPTSISSPSVSAPATPPPTLTPVTPAPQPTSPPTVQPSKAPLPSGTVSAVTLLNNLQVKAESNAASYNRDLFVHFIDADGDGQDARTEVLARASLVPVTINSNGTVTAGKWLSPYDGLTFTNPRDLDIDHLVPLAEAWRSGANTWNAQQRQAYANDLGYPGALIAVSAHENRSKSDKDVTAYLPPRTTYVCTYVKNWIAVKSRWRLSVDPTEKQTLTNSLRGCNPAVIKPGTPNLAALAGTVKSSSGTAGSSGTGGSGSSTTGSGTTTSPNTGTKQATDPQYATCTELKRHPNHAPYTKGVDPEYNWYTDRDGDGSVCE